MAARGNRAGTGPLVGVYLTYGVFWGVWVVVFEEFLEGHGMSPGGLSLQFVTLAATAVAMMAVVAPRLESRSRRATVAMALAIDAVGVALVAVAPTAWLFPAFAALGVGTGLVDVFVNAAGHEIERAAGASVLQWVHAAYGAGGVVGAMGAALGLLAGAPYGVLILGAAASQILAAAWAWTSTALATSGGTGRADARFSLGAFVRWPVLLLPGLVVVCSFFVEGSMDVWSVIFLRRTLGASTLAAASGFAAFALAIAVGRVFAARALFGMGYRRTIVVSGAGSVAAGVAAVVTSSPLVAGVAFLALGFFLSAATPAAMGLAGAATPHGGVAIAAVTTLGYTGFVVGPPIMSWLADAISLRATMVAVVVATLGIVAGAAVPRHEARAAEVPGVP